MDTKPDLIPPYVFYWTSFWELSTCRQEMGSIPWTAINDFCYRWKIDDVCEFDLFTRIMRSMDSAYREHMNGERERQRQNNKSKGRK